MQTGEVWATKNPLLGLIDLLYASRNPFNLKTKYPLIPNLEGSFTLGVFKKQ